MNFSRQRINVVSLFTEDFAATKSFSVDILGLPLAFEDETTAVFKLENIMGCLTDTSDAPI